MTSLSPTHRGKILLFACLIALLPACSTISKFDQYAYTQATSIKVDALNIMAYAVEPYDQHKPDVVKVKTSIDKIFEYEKNRPKNVLSEKMWNILKDSTGHLFGGFISRWQKEGKLDTVFIKEAQMIIGQSFDQISQLESGKIKSTQVTN